MEDKKKLEIPSWMKEMSPVALDALDYGLTLRFQTLPPQTDKAVADEIILLLAIVGKLKDSQK